MSAPTTFTGRIPLPDLEIRSPGPLNKLEPLVLSPLSPKPVVAECVNCQKKFYSRYPTTMHISSCCSKGEPPFCEKYCFVGVTMILRFLPFRYVLDCYTSYSWNLKKPSYHQLQEAEAAHWRSVHESAQDLTLLPVQDDETAMAELQQSTQELRMLGALSSKSSLFIKSPESERTITSVSDADSFSLPRRICADNFSEPRDPRVDKLSGRRVILEPLAASNLEQQWDLDSEVDTTVTFNHRVPRALNPHTRSFNGTFESAETEYTSASSFDGSSYQIAPVKSSKKDPSSNGGYFRKLINKLVR